MALSLVLDLVATDTLVCADHDLRARLSSAFAAGSAGRPRRILDSPDGSPYVDLQAIAVFDGGHGDATQECRACLIYGLGEPFALRAVPEGARLPALRTLAGASPALWQCGLGLATTPGDAATATLVRDLGRTMRGEWIDPLALFERVQQLSAKLRLAGLDGDLLGSAEDDRVARLEFEIATLKKTALLRQHDLLAAAAQRASAAR